MDFCECNIAECEQKDEEVLRQLGSVVDEEENKHDSYL